MPVEKKANKKAVEKNAEHLKRDERGGDGKLDAPQALPRRGANARFRR